MDRKQLDVASGLAGAVVAGEVLVLDSERGSAGSALLAGLAARGQRAAAARDEVEAMRRVVRGDVAAVVLVSATSAGAAEELRSALAEVDGSVELLGWRTEPAAAGDVARAGEADLRGDAACGLDEGPMAEVAAELDEGLGEGLGEALTSAELDALLANPGEGW
ncbi:MAG: hypothetical protein AAF823_04210 [Planctomycetota bacterium]